MLFLLYFIFSISITAFSNYGWHSEHEQGYSPPDNVGRVASRPFGHGNAVDGEPSTYYVFGMGGKFTGFIGIQLDDCKMVYRVHATQRMFDRGISEPDVWAVLRDGHLIEEYADDYPLPSCLVCGADENGRILHVVAALDASAKIIYIITTYIPDAQKWDDNFTRRRKP